MSKENLIKKYLRKELTAEENRRFEELVLNDEDFRQEAAFAAFMQAKERAKQQEHWRNLLKNKEKKAGKRLKIFPFPLQKAVALIVGIALISFLVYQYTSTETLETTLAKYKSEKCPPPKIFLAQGQAIDPQWEKAIEYYKTDQFEKAIPVLELLVTASPENKEYLLYLGLNKWYATPPDLPAAINIFSKVQKTGTIDLSQKARWFLALVLVEVGKTTEAKIVLNEIVDTEGHWMNKEARNLLGFD